MSNPCGCNEANSSLSSGNAPLIRQEDPTICPAMVHETVCVQAEVTIYPHVETGQIKSFCVDGPIIGACQGLPSPTGYCNFKVSQKICVQVPLMFSATAEAMPTGIVCGEPLVGSCENATGCTRTIGFFKNHPDVTNALITAAGGSIILGIDATGASFTVTTANANDVLSFNTPAPPAPLSPPFDQQYQVLYAQLLGAKLNVLNGATCDFAAAAIAAADAFLAASTPGVGQAGAPAVQEPLAQFNEGTVQGCPGHCL